MHRALLAKLLRVGARTLDAAVGRLIPLQPTLDTMAARANELHLEVTNLCNADCVFCPYHLQQRAISELPDAVFDKALADYVATGGGDVFFTPIVGDALIDKRIVERIRRARAYPQVGRIKLITNMILAHKRGIEALVSSGLSLLVISIAGFDDAMYRRVYRSPKIRHRQTQRAGPAGDQRASRPPAGSRHRPATGPPAGRGHGLSGHA